MSGMENITLFLQAAGVDQRLHHEAKVMDRVMTRVGFDRNSILTAYIE